MKLQRLSVVGFRSIANLRDLNIGSPTLLTGHNDAGKSAILDSVRFLLADYDVVDDDRTFSTAPRDEGVAPDRVEETLVEGEFDLSNDEQSKLNLPRTIRLRRASRLGASVYELHASVPVDSRLRSYQSETMDHLKARLQELGAATTGQKADLLSRLDELAENAEHTTVWESASADVVKVLPRVQRFNPSGTADAEESIRNALGTAYKAATSDEEFRGSVEQLEVEMSARLSAAAKDMRDHIMRRCDDIGEVQIVPAVTLTSGLRGTQIRVTSVSGEDVALGRSGAGRARRVSLAVWEFNTGMLQDAGDVVILYDEPDTHLDYGHQREFMDLVRSQCEIENVRMLIATHSMNLIDGIDISDVIHIRHEDGRTIAEKLADDSAVGSHLGGIAAALGLRNTVLLNERLFVAVEGQTEMEALPVLFKLATGKHLESCGIAIWSCNNNEGAIDFAEFLISHDRKVVFLVDNDSRNIKHAFSDKRLQARGLDLNQHCLYVGDPNELEDVFPDQLWADVANALWPRADEAAWVGAVHFAPLREGKKFSKELLSLLESSSESAPRGKPEMVSKLALHLSRTDQIPEPLLARFADLISRAA